MSVIELSVNNSFKKGTNTMTVERAKELMREFIQLPEWEQDELIMEAFSQRKPLFTMVEEVLG